MKFVDFQADAKFHGQAYLDAYQRVLSSGWYILGPEVEAFEAEFANYLGVKHVVGVGNGLEALQIALLSLGIGPGDEVITTPISAVATTLAILAVGAEPVFVDVDQNGQIDLLQIKTAITPSTRAIIPVHLYGNACDISAILRLATQHRLEVIEDAAQAHGSSINGRKLGSFGTWGCFSFYPTKNLGTLGGDAGALATNDTNLAQMARKFRNYGEDRKYHHVVPGLNSRLDELHAAFLRTKLKWLDRSNNQKRQIASEYLRGLSSLPALHLVNTPSQAIPNIHQFVVTTEARDALQQYLTKCDIPTLIHYPFPIHQQPFLKNRFAKLSLPVAEKFSRTTLSLPSHEFLTKEEIGEVITAIQTFFHK